MKDITKDQFNKFTKLQESSIINMTDIVRGAKLIKESEEVYEYILWNYDEISKKFDL